MGAGAAAIAVSVVGGAIAHEESRKSASQAKEGRKLARRGEAAAENENIRQQIREERVKRAQLMAAAESSGASGASSESGALSAMRSTVGSNIAFSKGQTVVADAVSKSMQQAADSATRSQSIQGFTNLASSSIITLDNAGVFDTKDGGDKKK